MEIAKIEAGKDYFGRKYWQITAPDGSWIRYFEYIGWTRETAAKAFAGNFEYYHGIN